MLRTIDPKLPTTYYLPSTTYYLLPTTYHLLQALLTIGPKLRAALALTPTLTLPLTRRCSPSTPSSAPPYPTPNPTPNQVLLTIDPKQRATAEDVLKMHWITGNAL